MVATLVAVLLAQLCPEAAAFNIPGSGKAPKELPRRGQLSPKGTAADLPAAKSGGEISWLQDAWSRYVLIRPGMTFQELKRSSTSSLSLECVTDLECALDSRVPGTVRTVVLTHVLCFLVAIPALLTNEHVFPKLVELAAIARLGLTPVDLLF